FGIVNHGGFFDSCFRNVSRRALGLGAFLTPAPGLLGRPLFWDYLGRTGLTWSPGFVPGRPFFLLEAGRHPGQGIKLTLLWGPFLTQTSLHRPRLSEDLTPSRVFRGAGRGA